MHETRNFIHNYHQLTTSVNLIHIVLLSRSPSYFVQLKCVLMCAFCISPSRLLLLIFLLLCFILFPFTSVCIEVDQVIFTTFIKILNGSAILCVCTTPYTTNALFTFETSNFCQFTLLIG